MFSLTDLLRKRKHATLSMMAHHFSDIAMENEMSSQQPEESKQAPVKKAGPLQIALAVFWSFFGVRKHKNWQEDAATITPVQAIIGGLIGAAFFVFLLLFIVKLVTR